MPIEQGIASPGKADTKQVESGHKARHIRTALKHFRNPVRKSRIVSVSRKSCLCANVAAGERLGSGALQHVIATSFPAAQRLVPVWRRCVPMRRALGKLAGCLDSRGVAQADGGGYGGIQCSWGYL